MMDRPTHVIIDGFDLNRVDEYGVTWQFESIDGWHTGPGVDVDQAQRVVAHGQFPQEGHRTGKVPTIIGWIKADNRAVIADAIDRLNAVLADGGFGLFEFHDRTQGMRWAEVQLFDRPLIPWDGSPSVRYQLQLLAPDPYRYGSTSTDSTPFASDPVGVGAVFPAFPGGVFGFGPVTSADVGIVTARNPGTAPATPRFSITGPAPAGGFQIIELATGNTVTYLGDLPTGSTLVIDPSDGSAVIDGVADRSGEVIVTGGWPTIPRGSERDYLFQPSGGSSASVLTVSCIATYW